MGGQTYIDSVLSFGLSSATVTKIFAQFQTLSNGFFFERCASMPSLHWRFLTFSPPAISQCASNLNTLTSSCHELGLPLVEEKIEGLVTVLTFVGIELDTKQMLMRLPQEKLARLKELIRSWREWKATQKRKLLSLIGQLAHACKIVAPGRIFLRRMINLAAARDSLDHWIRLNSAFKSWWNTFLESWNAVSLLESHINQPPHYHVFTDASGSCGCGAIWDDCWFQVLWSNNWAMFNIATKKLIPIVLASAMWGANGKQNISSSIQITWQ